MKRTPILIHDDREKLPWVIDGFTTRIDRLTYGDYTIKGFEKYLRIERKNSWEEIASNLSTEKNRRNLYRNLRNLHKLNGITAIFVEESFASLPLMKRFSGYVTFKTVMDFCGIALVQYNTPVIPIGKGPVRDEFLHKFFHRVITDHKFGKSWYKKL